jgi:hypothetical protein
MKQLSSNSCVVSGHIFCVQADLLLAGSGLASTATIIRNGAELLWQDLQPLLETAKQQGLCPENMFSKADINW